MQVPAIFVRLTRHAHHAPHLLLPAVVAHQHRDQLAHVQAVGLRPPLATIDLDTRGVDDDGLDPHLFQTPVALEAGAAGFVAAHHPARRLEPEELLRQRHLVLVGRD